MRGLISFLTVLALSFGLCISASANDVSGGSFSTETTVRQNSPLPSLDELHTRVTTALAMLPDAAELAVMHAEESGVLNNACIIGHSHVVGMQMYMDVEGLDYIAQVGMSASAALSWDSYDIPTGGKASLRYALQLLPYDSIYLMLGTNDLPAGPAYIDRYINNMSAVIDLICALQPQARLYILSIAPVGRTYCDYTPNFSKSFVIEYNEALKELAKSRELAFIDIFTPLADEEGYTREELAHWDGLHFNKDGCAVMMESILSGTENEAQHET